MKIGIEITAAVRQGGGIGRYVREMIRALAHSDAANRYQLFFASPNPVPFPPTPLPQNFSTRHLPFHDIWLARLWHRAQIPVNVEWITGEIDLYHAPDFVLPPTRARSLLTVHDLSFARDPDSAAPTLRDYLNVVVPRSVQRATHIIAVSQATKNDLVELYNTPEEKISVIHEGVDEKFRPAADKAISEKYGMSERPYLFSVSTIQPRKNYKRLIQALAFLPNEFELVIAGGKGWLYDDIFAEAEKFKGRVRFLGFVPDDDLPALYSGASVFAYPSLYEGFGLPLLEAMACGTPTVASNISCLPEVAADAAVTVSPYHPESIAAGIRAALANRSDLIEKGFARASQFKWQNSARQLIDLYAIISAAR
jgi:glycosyltransferase involved in cell wall biosynthesis